MLKNIIKIFLGKKCLQPIFEWLHKGALKGMNIGLGSDFSKSGEKWVLTHVKSKLEKKSAIIIFDVGANVGGYTKLVNKIFSGYPIEIFSFEPSKNTFLTLTDNLKNLNGVKIYNFGFGTKDETVTLYSDGQNSGLASIYDRDLSHLDTKLTTKEVVKIKTIDNFCQENNISEIDLLKIDVEGNELAVLKGAMRLINENKIKYIQFEFGGTDIDAGIYFKDFFNLLKDKYHLYRILKNGLRPINRYSETQEIFITTNFFAEKK